MSGVPISGSADDLLARAREMTGIDLVDHDAVEPLGVLLDSWNGESSLHADGAIEMERKVLRLLSNRLRIQRDFAAHPEIRDQPVRPPVFIFGLARTGTTKTQKILSASGDFNWWPLWQVLNPALFTGSPGESPQPRIDEADYFSSWYKRQSPEVMYGHEYSTFEPEEECMVLEHTLRTPIFFGFSVVNDYLRWVMTQDLSHQFVFLREMVQYLQWQGLADPNKRWILKCPLYHGMADQLLEVFPDAHVVMPHRDPAVSVPSWLRLAETLYIPFSDRTVDGPQQSRGLASGIRRHFRLRDDHPEWKILDVDFRDLVRSPESVIETIYDFAGETLSDDSRHRMLEWERSHPPHAKGKHRYSLEAFDLTTDGIAERFADYVTFQRERFGT